MILCITTTLVTFTLFGGGHFTVRGDEVISFQEATCRTYYPSSGLFSSGRTEDKPCRLITFRSGKWEKVTETTEEIRKILENKNGK